ncbi:hypothetical protein D3C79_1092830 [compost metagenome]
MQSIPWSAAPSSAWLLLVTSAFVTPIVTREVAAKPSAIRAAAVLEVPVSFLGERDGYRLAQDSAKRIGCCRAAK